LVTGRENNPGPKRILSGWGVQIHTQKIVGYLYRALCDVGSNVDWYG
jgi:hypothetical protein